MEKEINSAKNALVELKNKCTLLEESKNELKSSRKSDYQLENLTEKGIKHFKEVYKVEVLDSVSFKRVTRRYMEKKLAKFKLAGHPAFQSHKVQLKDYNIAYNMNANMFQSHKVQLKEKKLILQKLL